MKQNGLSNNQKLRVSKNWFFFQHTTLFELSVDVLFCPQLTVVFEISHAIVSSVVRLKFSCLVLKIEFFEPKRSQKSSKTWDFAKKIFFPAYNFVEAIFSCVVQISTLSSLWDLECNFLHRCEAEICLLHSKNRKFSTKMVPKNAQKSNFSKKDFFSGTQLCSSYLLMYWSNSNASWSLRSRMQRFFTAGCNLFDNWIVVKYTKYQTHVRPLLGDFVCWNFIKTVQQKTYTAIFYNKNDQKKRFWGTL